MNQPIIKVKNLNVELGGHIILQNINFEVYPNDTMAFIGPNGSGKTVLLKTILGLIPYQGEVILDPKIHIGYVPQRINLDPYLKITAEDLFNVKKKILKLKNHEIEDAIEALHLKKELLKKQISSLSGGDLQKILIVSALIGNPDLLLFDEPTANIDLPAEKTIYDSLEYLQQLKKFTLVLVSHDLNVVYQYTHHLVCINKKMICYGETEQMLKPEILKKLFGEKIFEHQFRHTIEKEHIEHKDKKHHDEKIY